MSVDNKIVDGSGVKIQFQDSTQVAILAFNLPDAEPEFKLAKAGPDLSIVIFEFDQWLRQLHKYQDIHTIGVVEVRDKLWELVNDRGLADVVL